MVPPPFRLPVLFYQTPTPSLPIAPPKKASRQKFSASEDEQLKNLVAELGESNWNEVANRLGTRTARQCRERFKNYLSPSIKNDPWTKEDDLKLQQKYEEYGPKWSIIASFFPSRSDVNIKNHWTRLTNKTNRERDVQAEKRELIQQIDLVIQTTKSQSNSTNNFLKSNYQHIPSLPPPPPNMIQEPVKPEFDSFSPIHSLPNSDNEFETIEWDNSDDSNPYLSFFDDTPFPYN